MQATTSRANTRFMHSVLLSSIVYANFEANHNLYVVHHDVQVVPFFPASKFVSDWHNVWQSNSRMAQAMPYSLNQIHEIGINSVVKAAINATAVNPPRSNAEAEMAAITAIPSCENAFRRAIYSPRISGRTISVVRACRGACRADAAMLSIAIAVTSQTPTSARATNMNRKASTMFDQTITFRLPA